MKKVKIGIVGGAGYTGGELLRILIHHPGAEIAFVHSNSHADEPVYAVHTDLLGDTDLKFSAETQGDIEVLFLCVGHGMARRYLEENPVADPIRIIDLSQDFRNEPVFESQEAGTSRKFIYGLPELNRESIREADNIANPGCFATGVQLALLPLAAGKLLKDEVHMTAVTGSTGAGQAPSATTHFSWRTHNLSVYKTFQHQHLKEISRSLHQLQPDFIPHLPEASAGKLNLIPYRGNFSRGIIVSAYTRTDLSLDEARDLYTDYYREHPFTHVSPVNTDLKQVVNTNKCLLYLDKQGDKLLIVSITDNLLKGASGQAVQNMNLMSGLEETTGLRLKAAAF